MGWNVTRSDVAGHETAWQSVIVCLLLKARGLQPWQSTGVGEAARKLWLPGATRWRPAVCAAEGGGTIPCGHYRRQTSHMTVIAIALLCGHSSHSVTTHHPVLCRCPVRRYSLHCRRRFISSASTTTGDSVLAPVLSDCQIHRHEILINDLINVIVSCTCVFVNACLNSFLL